MKANADWKMEDYLNNTYCMAALQHLAEFRKEHLLQMIEKKTILDEMYLAWERVMQVEEELRQNQEDLPPMADREYKLAAAIGETDPEMEPSTWMQAEIDKVNEWWEETFPEEENPLYLCSEEERMEEEERKIHYQELMELQKGIYDLKTEMMQELNRTE